MYSYALYDISQVGATVATFVSKWNMKDKNIILSFTQYDTSSSSSSSLYQSVTQKAHAASEATGQVAAATAAAAAAAGGRSERQALIGMAQSRLHVAI